MMESPMVAMSISDLIMPDVPVELKSAHINSQGRLEVVSNDQTLEYPVFWLRRNCLCKDCFNPYCQSPISSWKKLIELNVSLAAVSITEEGLVKCLFSDGHSGEYPKDWLYKRRMTLEGQKERTEAIYFHKREPWPSPEKVELQKCTWNEVTETEDGMEKLATSLMRHGICLITDTPDRGVYKEFAEKTSLLTTMTHYNDVFIVQTEASPISFAYTPGEIAMHTDLPHLTYAPDIQFLHCTRQSLVGGENVMSDVIRCARALREKHPDYFRILTTRRIEREDVIIDPHEHNFYIAGAWPTIIVDDDGEPIQVRSSHSAESGYFSGTVEEYEEYAAALKTFYKILYEQSIKIKSLPGYILAFDNQRVMHGRLPYDPTYARRLEGWYTTWDMLYSRLRVCKIKKGLQQKGKQ